jgi:hypothetical protein
VVAIRCLQEKVGLGGATIAVNRPARRRFRLLVRRLLRKTLLVKQCCLCLPESSLTARLSVSRDGDVRWGSGAVVVSSRGACKSIQFTSLHLRTQDFL